MNLKYYNNRIENSRLGSLGHALLDAETTLCSQEYEIEILRIKAAKYKAFFFRDSELGEKLGKQEEENRNALIGEFDGFSWASWRASAIFRTLEDMLAEGILSESEYRRCESI